ncbi:hypothetical protein [Methylobacterium sp. L1A1]|uniref:hypothetical protein n=1 Tax=Methylorubrum sp. POS3 TaxID=2998492 RepID=UPI0010F52142|nr:hypothetical protein [Methylobacterium sp. L1A1]
MSNAPDLGDELPLPLRIHVDLARMVERQKAMQDTADARHAQLVSMLATYVPRAEVEAQHEAVERRFDGLEKRVTGIETRTWKVIAWMLGSIGTSLLGVFGFHISRGS